MNIFYSVDHKVDRNVNRKLHDLLHTYTTVMIIIMRYVRPHIYMSRENNYVEVEVPESKSRRHSSILLKNFQEVSFHFYTFADESKRCWWRAW